METADRKCVFGCSFSTGWPYSPLPVECVRSSRTGLGWRHLEQTGSDPLPSENWLWVVAGLPVEAAVRLHACVSQKRSVVHNSERRGSTEGGGTRGSKVTRCIFLSAHLNVNDSN